MSRILVLSNHYNTLRIFRRELLEEMFRLGHEVVVSIPPCDHDNVRILESYGCRIIITPEMNRRGLNPLQDMRLLRRYQRLLREEKPDKVIAYTIKPNIYGGLAARRLGIPFYANVTGLGSSFQKGRGLMRLLVSFLYRISLKRAKAVFFENRGNWDTLVQYRIIRSEQAVLMPGAGVNLQAFSPAAYPGEEDGIRFLFVGRIMREKGVDELFSAIRQLRSTHPQAEFDFIGWYEDAYQGEVEHLQEEGLIRFHGFQAEVRPYMERCHCVVLPSWHEGLSNTLLEGAAMARPLVTTRIHGCMEVVEEGISGFLAVKGDAQDLGIQLERFLLLSREEKKRMGLAGRKLVETRFDKREVVAKTLHTLGLPDSSESPSFQN